MQSIPLETLLQALNASQDGIMIFDRDVTVVYANDKALDLNGLIKQEALGRTWYELEQTGHFHGNAALEALRTKKPSSSEFVNQLGKHLLSTCTPILDNGGEPQYLISNLRDMSELSDLQRKLLERKKQIAKLQHSLHELNNRNEKNFVYISPAMRKIILTIDRIAETDVSILLLGESGVGKSAVAERIHAHSLRSDGPLIIVNCGAIPASLCEAEFFGYEKGAFTGADYMRPGIFESANGGTLILDEIGELPLDMQVKLLRVLQNSKVKRIGSQKEQTLNFRLIAATNQNLKEKVLNGSFREDLYYRINIVKFVIPPLRERPDDIKQMLIYYLEYYNKKYKVHKTMSPELVSALEHYSWPGNAREMAHLIERMVVLSTSQIIDCEYLTEDILPVAKKEIKITTLKEAVQTAERALLTETFKIFKNTRRMAKVLDVSHSTVARKLNEYKIK